MLRRQWRENLPQRMFNDVRHEMNHMRAIKQLMALSDNSIKLGTRMILNARVARKLTFCHNKKVVNWVANKYSVITSSELFLRPVDVSITVPRLICRKLFCMNGNNSNQRVFDVMEEHSTVLSSNAFDHIKENAPLRFSSGLGTDFHPFKRDFLSALIFPWNSFHADLSDSRLHFDNEFTR